MSQLRERTLAYLATTDYYDISQMTWSVGGNVAIIKNSLLGQAIAALPPKRYEVILLSYFTDKNDTKIGTILIFDTNYNSLLQKDNPF